MIFQALQRWFDWRTAFMCATATTSAVVILGVAVVTLVRGGPFEGYETVLFVAALAWLVIAAADARAGHLSEDGALRALLASTVVVVGTGLLVPLLWWHLLALAVLPVVPLMGVCFLRGARLAALLALTCAGMVLIVLNLELDGAVRALVVGVEVVLVTLPTTALAIMTSRLDALRALAERSARTDVLTGLQNRHGMSQALPRVVAAAATARYHLGVLILDLDHFKSINDTYGHSAGDRVLAQVAAAVSGTVRAEDVAVRWGGEELAVVAGVPDRDGLRALGERLRRTVAAVVVEGVPGVTVSIGAFSAVPEEVARADGSAVATWDLVSHLMDLADEALYEAKRGGRDRVVVSRAASPDADDAGAASSAGSAGDPESDGGAAPLVSAGPHRRRSDTSTAEG